MPNVDSVTVADLAQNVRLTVLQGEDYLNRQITTSDICRPSLEFAGYFKHYPAMRIQLLGITETSFAKEVPADKRREYIERMCTPQTPCFVVSTDLPVMDELKTAAEKAHIPILGTPLTSSRILGNMTSYLVGRLAPRESLHGVLVDISGVGVLITGDSGVGKSETALELVRRGHRLVADDRVEVYARDEQTLVGAAPTISPAPDGNSGDWDHRRYDLVRIGGRLAAGHDRLHCPPRNLDARFPVRPLQAIRAILSSSKTWPFRRCQYR